MQTDLNKPCSKKEEQRGQRAVHGGKTGPHIAPLSLTNLAVIGPTSVYCKLHKHHNCPYIDPIPWLSLLDSADELSLALSLFAYLHVYISMKMITKKCYLMKKLAFLHQCHDVNNS